jgi:hypothetical protein
MVPSEVEAPSPCEIGPPDATHRSPIAPILTAIQLPTDVVAVSPTYRDALGIGQKRVSRHQTLQRASSFRNQYSERIHDP